MFLTDLTHYWASKAFKSKYNLPSILKKRGESMHAHCFFVHFFNNRFLKQKHLRKFHLPAFLPFHLFPLKTQTNFFVQNSQKSPSIFYAPQKIIFFCFFFFCHASSFFWAKYSIYWFIILFFTFPPFFVSVRRRNKKRGADGSLWRPFTGEIKRLMERILFPFSPVLDVDSSFCNRIRLLTRSLPICSRCSLNMAKNADPILQKQCSSDK